MTLDEFIKYTPILMSAFADATRYHNKLNPKFGLERDEVDWCREVAAYVMYVNAEEETQTES